MFQISNKFGSNKEPEFHFALLYNPNPFFTECELTGGSRLWNKIF